MRTASIKLKMGAENVLGSAGSGTRRRVLNFFLLSLAGLAALYVFFLGETVFNIVGRQSLEREARILANQVSQLEQGYLSASRKIDLNLSHSLGFREVSPEYAIRRALGSVQIPNNEL